LSAQPILKRFIVAVALSDNFGESYLARSEASKQERIYAKIIVHVFPEFMMAPSVEPIASFFAVSETPQCCLNVCVNEFKFYIHRSLSIQTEGVISLECGCIVLNVPRWQVSKQEQMQFHQVVYISQKHLLVLYTATPKSFEHLINQYRTLNNSELRLFSVVP
jgi:hypothetical protein